MRQPVHIVDLTPDRNDSIQQAARLLTAAFHAPGSGAWSAPEDALQEVREMMAPDRIARAALAGQEVVGWIRNWASRSSAWCRIPTDAANPISSWVKSASINIKRLIDEVTKLADEAFRK